MIDVITNINSFYFLLALFAVGGFGALLLRKNEKLANTWTHVFAIAGSTWGIIFSLTSFLTDHNYSIKLNTFSPQLSFPVTFNLDNLSLFFIFIISLISVFASIYGYGYVKHYYAKYSIGLLGFLMNIFILGMYLVVTSSNMLCFLFAWELMSLSSYFLVIYENRKVANVKAGLIYLIMTHLGTALILVAFMLVFKYTGSIGFDSLTASVSLIPQEIKNIVFVLLLIGFGTKSGIIPFHIWLPSAHPSAPSHISALMSGVMIKTGIYMMIRFFIEILSPAPLWWGIVILIIGAISSVLGVLYALTEHDIKRLLAYHSIENIGIILLGVGSSMIFGTLGLTGLSLVALVAALFHTLNHAVFKSLLFLSAGSIINQTHTRNIEEYGGLLKLMPFTGLFFLIGSMAISALPPLNGFFSEWLTYQSLFAGITSDVFVVKYAFTFATAALALTGGLALACFVKAFGTTFLAKPRSEEAAKATESNTFMLIGMFGLGLLTIIIGFFSGDIISAIKSVPSKIIFSRENISASSNITQASISRIDASVSSPIFFIVFLSILLIVFIIVKKLINKNQVEKTSITWDCGTDLTPRMEITATGFSKSITRIFKRILFPTSSLDTQYGSSDNQYFPKSRTLKLGFTNIYEKYLYFPVTNLYSLIAEKFKSIQNGNVNAYILYIFIALLIALLFTV